MATQIKVRTLHNPRKVVKVKNRPKKTNSKPRHLSTKQIRIFGTKRQKAALRKKYTHNPAKRPAARNPSSSRPPARKSHNPAPVIITLGAVNPKRRTNTVAAKRNKKNPSGRPTVKVNRRPKARHHKTAHHKHHNPTKIVVLQKKPNRHRPHHRNPISTTLFGKPLFGKDSLELVAGGLAGVVAAKFIPTLFPASITGGIASSNFGRTVITGISAVVAGWLGSKITPTVGQGMLFGGMVQTVSVALNAFLPAVYSQLNPQLGRLVDASYPVPQNPLRQLSAPAPMPSALPPAGGQARVMLNGLARAYGPAF